MEQKRLIRSEKNPLYMLISLVSSMNYAKEDLADRLTMVQNGNERMCELTKQINDLMLEVIDTIPSHQGKSLVGTLKDYEIRVVPKLTPVNHRSVLDKEDLRTLIDCSQEAKCISCVLNGDECRNCPLEKVLEKYVPLDTYESHLCPYNMATWEN